MASIPASQLVNVTPNVLPAGGSAIDMNGLIITNSNRVPIGSVASFPTAGAVSAYFGASALETSLASIYFAGFTGAFATPGALLFANYPVNGVSAFLRGGNVGAQLSLTQLQALSGSLNLTVDGQGRNVGSISLAGAVSFSGAATIMQNALNGSAPSNLASFTGSIGASGTLTVSILSTGTIGIGETVSGSGVAAGVVILSQVSGSAGGTGVYSTSATGTVGSQAMTCVATPIVVSYDSVSGAFIFTSGATGVASTIAFATGQLSGSLLLTLVTGAVISQGAAPATPSGFMTALAAATQNWGLFMTSFNPDSVVGTNTNKLAFALWTSQQNNRYGYVPWDTDASPTVSNAASSSLGQQIIAAGYSGAAPVWDPNGNGPPLAAFVLGIAAAIDFNQFDGRVDFAYRGQAGFSIGVTDPTVAANLDANGYNFYGAWATATTAFQFLQPGSISGGFAWLDSFVNQIWLNANFQQTLLELLSHDLSIPYTPTGYATIENALLTPINAGLNFGAFRAGVVLSSSQILEINSIAGNNNAAQSVSTRGWYLQVSDPGPTVRQVRGSPIVNFWYADGESIQRINMTSIDVQ